MQTVNPGNGSKTRREAAVLVFVVFLLGLLVGGVGNHLWGERVWGHNETSPRQGPPSRAKVIDDLTRELQLTPDQQKQLGTIIDETRAEWAAQHEQIRQQIRQRGRARIRAILTPDQQAKFEQFMQRIDEQRRKDQAPQAQH
jgi:Spy/CpxP family protein refolding chaperone